jgi:Arc/MetJ-type ribon-helix-helix transcriptional regulator
MSINVTRKRRGRPATGQDPVLGIRLPGRLIDDVEAWIKQQKDRPSRSEAIRRLLSFALKGDRTTVRSWSLSRNVPNGPKSDLRRVLDDRRKSLTSFQIRAARAILGWSAEDLARESSVSLRTIRRAELTDFHTKMTAPNDLSVRRALEAAGVEFIDENGGGPGVRLRKRQQKKG